MKLKEFMSYFVSAPSSSRSCTEEFGLPLIAKQGNNGEGRSLDRSYPASTVMCAMASTAIFRWI